MGTQSAKFGKIAILSDLDLDGEEQREDVECAFDALKNPLESDKTYLRDARELLLKLSKVYMVTNGKREIVSEIPKKWKS